MVDAPEPAVRMRDRACGASKRLANDVWNDAGSRAAADDKVDGAAACELRPGLWGRTEDGARGFRSKPRHDLAEAAAVALDQRFCGRAERSDDARHSTDGIDERLEGKVAEEGCQLPGDTRGCCRSRRRADRRTVHRLVQQTLPLADRMKAKLVCAGMNGGAASGTGRRAGGRFGVGKSVPGNDDRARLFGPGVSAPTGPCTSLISTVNDAVSGHSIGTRTSVRRPATPELTTWATFCCETESPAPGPSAVLISGCCWSSVEAAGALPTRASATTEGESQKGERPNRARSHAPEVRPPEARGLDWLRRSAPGRRRLTAQAILERSFGGRSKGTTSCSPR
jgi:hypothetical protein